MAEVYLAEQISLRRQVASRKSCRHAAGRRIKTYVHAPFTARPKPTASLVHSRTSSKSTRWAASTAPTFIAQEYVSGQNLKEYLIAIRR